MVKKKIDPRVRTLIENGVANRHRSLFVLVRRTRHAFDPFFLLVFELKPASHVIFVLSVGGDAKTCHGRQDSKCSGGSDGML